MNDFYEAAKYICNPLASPGLGINAHLRRDEVEEGRRDAISNLANEILRDREERNLLEDESSLLLDRKEAYLDAIFTGVDVEIAKVDLLIAYKREATIKAAKILEEERRQNLEDAAVEAWEFRKECE